MLENAWGVLGEAAGGLIGVDHRTGRGWESQPEWLTSMLRIADVVASSPEGVRRRAVIVTPHPSPLVALIAAHVAVRRFESSRLPSDWWDHEPTPRAAVRMQHGEAELLLFRQVERKSDGDFSLRFGTARGTRLMVSSRQARELVPIPVEVLPDPSKAQMLDMSRTVFDSTYDYLRGESIPYALGTDASLAIVGRKDETRAQLENNSVRNQNGGVADLAALARVKELAHAASHRSRWVSPEAAGSGAVDEDGLLILNGGPAVSATIHDLEDHPWIAVLDRASPSLAEAVSQVEQYYFSVETQRIDMPAGTLLAKGHEVLLFEELA